MAGSKFIKANERIAENVTTGFEKMSNGVVSGFGRITEGVAKGYTAIEDKFVGKFLTREGETVEEAKKRLAENAANLSGIENVAIYEDAGDIQPESETSETKNEAE